MSYSRIVVGTDGSPTADHAVQTAADLARQLGAELHIVTAFQTPGGGRGAASGASMAVLGAPTGFHAEGAMQIADKAAVAWGEGIATQTHAVSRSPADALVETAENVQADLIVVGSKGMHGARRVLGSVPNSVAHGAGCAVLIVKTD